MENDPKITIYGEDETNCRDAELEIGVYPSMSLCQRDNRPIFGYIPTTDHDICKVDETQSLL